VWGDTIGGGMSPVGTSSWASSPSVRRSMQSNGPRDTAPEIALRSALHRRGLRFRKHVRPVQGLACTVDVLFPTERLAVFVDGCYWHSCPEHVSYPRTNGEWWRAKLDATRERDWRNTKALTDAGWRVLRLWEHEDVETAADRVGEALKEIRPEQVDESVQSD
jgi:DNA mismatch endonuclease, patch repair protein